MRISPNIDRIRQSQVGGYVGGLLPRENVAQEVVLSAWSSAVGSEKLCRVLEDVGYLVVRILVVCGVFDRKQVWQVNNQDQLFKRNVFPTAPGGVHQPTLRWLCELFGKP